MNNRICVYTCITGDYDVLNEIENIEEEIDYYCFTNNKNIKSNTWKVIYIKDDSLTNIELARKIKILGHPVINETYDTQLWMDGSISFNKKIMDFIKTYLGDKDTFVAFRHGKRNTIKEESKACIQLKKEKRENIDRLMAFYKKEKYKDDNGLIESTVYIKRVHDKLVQETMKLWFSMITSYTTRDQLSFNYCIDKTGLSVKWINKKVFDNDWFDYKNHNFPNKIESYRLYFGNSEKYNIENDIQGKYIIKDNKYTISTKIPDTVDNITLEFSSIPCTILKSIQIKDHRTSDNIFYFNFIEYKDKKLFYNKDAIIKIFDKYEKDEFLTIELELEVLNYNSVLDVFDKTCVKLIHKEDKIKKLIEEKERIEKEKEEIKEEKDTIIHSRGWRYLEKIRRIKNKICFNKRGL